MFSVSPAEIITIAVIALLVFGPRRLPEISRKAGKVLRELRDTAADLKAGFERELEETVGPLSDVRREMRATLDPSSEPRSVPDLEEGGGATAPSDHGQGE